MSLSARQLKAINWYCITHNIKPALSTPPIMYFTNKQTGTIITADLTLIITAYDKWNEEDKKQRAKERRAEREFQKKQGAAR